MFPAMKPLLPRPLALGALCAALSGLALSAAGAPPTGSTSGSSSSGGETREATNSYTDRGETRVDVNYSGNYDSMYFNGRSSFGSMPFYSGFSSSVYVQRREIFLPPTPPALGEPVASRPVQPSLHSFTLPKVLRSHMYETFYAPLSALMYLEDLPRKRRDAVDTYTSRRDQAVIELRQKIDSLAGADTTTRHRELSAFATQQASVIADLEDRAAEVRDLLVNGSWLYTGVDWDDLRSWRLGDDTRWESAYDEIKVAIGATFFQEGLSNDQRLLLRELAMELADSMASPDRDISLTSTGPYLYFSPATARIRLPIGLPAEVTAKIDQYRSRKSALKRELRDELYKQDRAFFHSTRANALKALAAKQAPEFAAVEQLAEEIRVALAAHPNPARPPAPPVPTELGRRIESYLARKNTWQKTMLDKLSDLRNQFPNDRVEFIRNEDRSEIRVVPNRRSKPEVTAKRDSILADLASFNATQRTAYDQLAQEKVALQTDLQQFVSQLAGQQRVKTADQLMREFSQSLGRLEQWQRYADYETAVLQPGLSAGQRRILFGAALEKLDLPLFNR